VHANSNPSPLLVNITITQFSELADIAIDYIQAEYSRPADDVARVNVAKEWFKDRSADSITCAEIREKLKEAADRKKVVGVDRKPPPQRDLTVLSAGNGKGEG
jgi:hypothetical protein